MALEDRLANRLLNKYRALLTPSQIRQALLDTTNAERDLLVSALKKDAVTQVGKIVSRIVMAHMKAKARADIDAKMADGALDRAELEDLLL